MARGAVIALSHGGGPMPLLGDSRSADVIRSLRERVPKILKLNSSERPRAIIVVTAHWSEKHPTISSAASHELYYDYYNFPEEAYSIKYPAPGAPGLAQELADALRDEGFEPQLDSKRGWDHGVFVPMKIINPSADMPILQMSVLESEDADEHFRLGKALARFRDSNVAIVGSGSATFHNLRIMRQVMSDSKFRAENDSWSGALNVMVEEPSLEARGQKLSQWRSIPGSYQMHPQNGAEHFLPLIVCAGAGGDSAAQTYNDELFGMNFFSYYWE